MWTEIITLFAVLFVYIYFKFTRKYGMFSAKGIFEPPKYFPFGTLCNWKVMMGQVPFFKSLDEMYEKYGKDNPLLGTFATGDPVLVINDLELAKNIMIKDFDHFTDVRPFGMDTTTEANKYIAPMLPFVGGEKWKRIRSLMTPAFTSGKLKAMVPLIQKVGDDFMDHLEGFSKSGNEIEVKDVITHYTLDCLATCGFGVEGNSFKEPNGQFRQMVLKAIGASDQGSLKLMMKALVSMFFPNIATLLKLSVFDGDAMLYLANVVKSAVAHRRKVQIKRGDLIDIVIEAMDSHQSGALIDSIKKHDTEHPAESIEVIKDEVETVLIANVIVLFFAGFDTTSTTTTAMLGYLSKYPDVQEKLFQEINDAIEDRGTSDLDYETIQGLPYLDQFFFESLRVYAGITIERQCTKDYKIPGMDFTVPKGMMIQINSNAIHHDPHFYPDPNNFNPEENFSAETRAQRPTCAFLTFGQGPRGCIGVRLGQLMVKMCLVKILSKFKVLAGPSQPKEIVMSAKNFNGMPEGGVWCKVEKR